MVGGWEIDKNTQSGSYFNVIVQNKAVVRQELLIFEYNDLVFILGQ